MTDNKLAATVAALNDGDRVRATFIHGDTKHIVEGTVAKRHGCVVAGDWELTTDRWDAPDPDLTAVEVLAPALPSEPPVGSGVFHDGVLWWRHPITGEWWSVGDLGRALASWADLQPCVPAVPASHHCVCELAEWERDLLSGGTA